MARCRDALTALLLAVLAAGLVVDAEAQQLGAGEGMLQRSDCVQLVRRKRDQEAAGMRDVIGQPPAAVARDQGPAFLQKVRDYIRLREMVLFRCPPNVLNATAAPLEERMKAAPPLPGRGPKLERRAVQRPVGPVPLPVPRPI